MSLLQKNLDNFISSSLYTKLLSNGSPREAPTVRRGLKALIKRLLERRGYTVHRTEQKFSFTIDRQILVFEKDMPIQYSEHNAFLDAYWNSNHRFHSHS